MKVISTNGLNQTTVQIPAKALPKGTDLEGIRYATADGKNVSVKLMAAAFRMVAAAKTSEQDALVGSALAEAISAKHPKDADRKIYGVWGHHVSKVRGDADVFAANRAVKAAVV